MLFAALLCCSLVVTDVALLYFLLRSALLQSSVNVPLVFKHKLLLRGHSMYNLGLVQPCFSFALKFACTYPLFKNFI